jgi:hypothetical protein
MILEKKIEATTYIEEKQGFLSVLYLLVFSASSCQGMMPK